jgi:hypothetical protein
MSKLKKEEIKKYAFELMEASLKLYPKATKAKPEHLLSLGYQSSLLNFLEPDDIHISFGNLAEKLNSDKATKQISINFGYVEDIIKPVLEAYNEVKNKHNLK